jgi:hypothetical protein
MARSLDVEHSVLDAGWAERTVNVCALSEGRRRRSAQAVTLEGLAESSRMGTGYNDRQAFREKEFIGQRNLRRPPRSHRIAGTFFRRPIAECSPKPRPTRPRSRAPHALHELCRLAPERPPYRGRYS